MVFIADNKLLALDFNVKRTRIYSLNSPGAIYTLQNWLEPFDKDDYYLIPEDILWDLYGFFKKSVEHYPDHIRVNIFKMIKAALPPFYGPVGPRRNRRN